LTSSKAVNLCAASHCQPFRFSSCEAVEMLRIKIGGFEGLRNFSISDQIRRVAGAWLF
jgi:hypothetical protein